MNTSESTRDTWDNLLTKVMKQRKPSRAPLTGDEIIRIALGELRAPTEMDPGEIRLLETMREVVRESETEADERGIFEIIALKLGESVRALASTFQFADAQFAAVRGESSVQGIEGTTDNGTRILLAGSVKGVHELIMTWPNEAPTRVQMKFEGELLESAPVEANRVVFPLKSAGIYSVTTKRGSDTLERLTFSVDLDQ